MYKYIEIDVDIVDFFVSNCIVKCLKKNTFKYKFKSLLKLFIRKYIPILYNIFLSFILWKSEIFQSTNMHLKFTHHVQSHREYQCETLKLR